MKKLHLICNAHIDPIWLWTWDEGIAAAIATFKAAADLCDEFDYIFCHNESLLYEAVEKYAPELFDRIKNLVKCGKWKIAGGWYLQPDCNMPCGESFVRQIAYGKNYFYEKFGVIPHTAVNYDSFGHNIGLVQILKKNGYDSYIFSRPAGDKFSYPGLFFKWTAPDGSSIVCGRVSSYGSAMGCAAQKIGEYVDAMKEDTEFVLWGVGNHGGGPSRKDLSDIKNLNYDNLEILHSYPEAVFEDDIRIAGEVFTSLQRSMPGCYTSMMRMKQSHRETENLLYSTEKLLSSAILAGYKPDLTKYNEVQKRLLLSEFHDILPGTCIPEGEKEGLDLLSTCKKIISDYKTGAYLYLVMGEKTAKEGEYPFFVYNFAPYSVKCPIEAEFTLSNQNWDDNYVTVPCVYDENGKKIECQMIKEKPTLNLDWRKRFIFDAELKPMAITRFSVFTEKVENIKKTRENKELDVLIRNSNLLKGNVKLKIYDDTADPWAMSNEESVNVGKNPLEFELMSEEEATEFCAVEKILPVHTIEDGCVYTAVEQFVKSDNTRGVIEYKFYKNQPYVDLKITLEFTSKNKIIRLAIPVPEGKFIGDGPYVVEYKGDTEIPFQKWVGVETDNGIYSIINDGIYGGMYKDGYIELSLVRGAGYSFHPIGDRKLYPEDRYLPRIDCGRYIYNIRLFKGSLSEVCEKALEFNEQPYCVNVFPINTGKKQSVIKTDKPVNMEVCKPSDKGIVLRFYNPEKYCKDFNLTIEDLTENIIMNKGEVVSCIYDGEKIITLHNEMPV